MDDSPSAVASQVLAALHFAPTAPTDAVHAVRDDLWVELQRSDAERRLPTHRKTREGDVRAALQLHAAMQERMVRGVETARSRSAVASANDAATTPPPRRTTTVPLKEWKEAGGLLPTKGDRFVLRSADRSAAPAELTFASKSGALLKFDVRSAGGPATTPLVGEFRVEPLPQRKTKEGNNTKKKSANAAVPMPFENGESPSLAYQLNFLDSTMRTTGEVEPTRLVCKQTAVHDAPGASPLFAVFDRRCRPPTNAPPPPPFPRLEALLEGWADDEAGELTEAREFLAALCVALGRAPSAAATAENGENAAPSAADGAPAETLALNELLNAHLGEDAGGELPAAAVAPQRRRQLDDLLDGRPVEPRFLALVGAYVDAHWTDDAPSRARTVGELVRLELRPTHGARAPTARAWVERVPADERARLAERLRAYAPAGAPPPEARVGGGAAAFVPYAEASVARATYEHVAYVPGATPVVEEARHRRAVLHATPTAPRALATYADLYDAAFAQLERTGWQVARVNAPCLSAFATAGCDVSTERSVRRDATRAGAIAVRLDPRAAGWSTMRTSFAHPCCAEGVVGSLAVGGTSSPVRLVADASGLFAYDAVALVDHTRNCIAFDMRQGAERAAELIRSRRRVPLYRCGVREEYEARDARTDAELRERRTADYLAYARRRTEPPRERTLDAIEVGGVRPASGAVGEVVHDTVALVGVTLAAKEGGSEVLVTGVDPDVARRVHDLHARARGVLRAAPKNAPTFPLRLRCGDRAVQAYPMLHTREDARRRRLRLATAEDATALASAGSTAPPVLEVSRPFRPMASAVPLPRLAFHAHAAAGDAAPPHAREEYVGVNPQSLTLEFFRREGRARKAYEVKTVDPSPPEKVYHLWMEGELDAPFTLTYSRTHSAPDRHVMWLTVRGRETRRRDEGGEAFEERARTRQQELLDWFNQRRAIAKAVASRLRLELPRDACHAAGLAQLEAAQTQKLYLHAWGDRALSGRTSFVVGTLRDAADRVVLDLNHLHHSDVAQLLPERLVRVPLAAGQVASAPLASQPSRVTLVGAVSGALEGVRTLADAALRGPSFTCRISSADEEQEEGSLQVAALLLNDKGRAHSRVAIGKRFRVGAVSLYEVVRRAAPRPADDEAEEEDEKDAVDGEVRRSGDGFRLRTTAAQAQVLSVGSRDVRLDGAPATVVAIRHGEEGAAADQQCEVELRCEAEDVADAPTPTIVYRPVRFEVRAVEGPTLEPDRDYRATWCAPRRARSSLRLRLPIAAADVDEPTSAVLEALHDANRDAVFHRVDVPAEFRGHIQWRAVALRPAVFDAATGQTWQNLRRDPALAAVRKSMGADAAAQEDGALLRAACDRARTLRERLEDAESVDRLREAAALDAALRNQPFFDVPMVRDGEPQPDEPRGYMESAEPKARVLRTSHDAPSAVALVSALAAEHGLTAAVLAPFARFAFGRAPALRRATVKIGGATVYYPALHFSRALPDALVVDVLGADGANDASDRTLVAFRKNFLDDLGRDDVTFELEVAMDRSRPEATFHDATSHPNRTARVRLDPECKGGEAAFRDTQLCFRFASVEIAQTFHPYFRTGGESMPRYEVAGTGVEVPACTAILRCNRVREVRRKACKARPEVVRAWRARMDEPKPPTVRLRTSDYYLGDGSEATAAGEYARPRAYTHVEYRVERYGVGFVHLWHGTRSSRTGAEDACACSAIQSTRADFDEAHLQRIRNALPIGGVAAAPPPRANRLHVFLRETPPRDVDPRGVIGAPAARNARRTTWIVVPAGEGGASPMPAATAATFTPLAAYQMLPDVRLPVPHQPSFRETWSALTLPIPSRAALEARRLESTRLACIQPLIRPPGATVARLRERWQPFPVRALAEGGASAPNTTLYAAGDAILRALDDGEYVVQYTLVGASTQKSFATFFTHDRAAKTCAMATPLFPVDAWSQWWVYPMPTEPGTLIKTESLLKSSPNSTFESLYLESLATPYRDIVPEVERPPAYQPCAQRGPIKCTAASLGPPYSITLQGGAAEPALVRHEGQCVHAVHAEWPRPHRCVLESAFGGDPDAPADRGVLACVVEQEVASFGTLADARVCADRWDARRMSASVEAATRFVKEAGALRTWTEACGRTRSAARAALAHPIPQFDHLRWWLACNTCAAAVAPYTPHTPAPTTTKEVTALYNATYQPDRKRAEHRAAARRVTRDFTLSVLPVGWSRKISFTLGISQEESDASIKPTKAQLWINNVSLNTIKNSKKTIPGILAGVLSEADYNDLAETTPGFWHVIDAKSKSSNDEPSETVAITTRAESEFQWTDKIRRGAQVQGSLHDRLKECSNFRMWRDVMYDDMTTPPILQDKLRHARATVEEVGEDSRVSLRLPHDAVWMDNGLTRCPDDHLWDARLRREERRCAVCGAELFFHCSTCQQTACMACTYRHEFRDRAAFLVDANKNKATLLEHGFRVVAVDFDDAASYTRLTLDTTTKKNDAVVGVAKGTAVDIVVFERVGETKQVFTKLNASKGKNTVTLLETVDAPSDEEEESAALQPSRSADGEPEEPNEEEPEEREAEEEGDAYAPAAQPSARSAHLSGTREKPLLVSDDDDDDERSELSSVSEFSELSSSDDDGPTGSIYDPLLVDDSD